jgi:hypothetical protein
MFADGASVVTSAATGGQFRRVMHLSPVAPTWDLGVSGEDSPGNPN